MDKSGLVSINKITLGAILMKKLILLLTLTVILFMGATPDHSTVTAQETQIPPPPDEAMINSFLQNTYATSMIFKGSNQNWDCSLTVLNKLEAKNDELEKSPQVIVMLCPKFTWESYITRLYEYMIHTSNGCYHDYQWIKSGEYIYLNTDNPVPTSAEKITAQIIRGSAEDIIEMNNRIPLDVISPKDALRILLEVYRDTYGSYPTDSFSFYVEFREPQYWIVSFDDNDGIGGRGYLLINAYTGDAGDIREDE
jgi:hypothetical protein